MAFALVFLAQYIYHKHLTHKVRKICRNLAHSITCDHLNSLRSGHFCYVLAGQSLVSRDFSHKGLALLKVTTYKVRPHRVRNN